MEGDWRLPTLKELKQLTTGADFIRSSPMFAFTGVQANFYWSSTTNSINTVNAWRLLLTNGLVSDNDKALSYFVWPVRGGQ